MSTTNKRPKLPSAFQERIYNDMSKLSSGENVPLPIHIQNRRYILENAASTARTTDDALKQIWQAKKKQLKNLIEKLKARDNQIKATICPRVREMWGDANLALIEHVITKADPKNGQEVADFIIRGVPTYGDLPKTDLFESMTPAEVEKFHKKQNAALEKFKLKEKTEIPKWASKAQLIEAHKTFIKKARNPQEVHLPFDELKTPVYCFPVAQGDRTWCKSKSEWIYAKIRPCMDFRFWNGYNHVQNKISYAGPEMVTRCCLEFLGIKPDFRLTNRKQVFANIENERCPAEPSPKKQKPQPPLDHPRPFAIAKTDFTNFYYWFPAREEYDVLIADGEKYRTYRIGHASFGSLQAIFCATILSEALCSFLNKELKICASIYIDDTIIIAPENCVDDVLDLTLFFYKMIKIPIQTEKVETLLPTPLSLVPIEIFRVLGLQYSIKTSPLQLHIQLPPSKKETLIHEIKLVQDLILEKSLKLPLIQSVTGQLIHALFFRRHSVTFAKMKPLFVASDEKRFNSVIKLKQFRVLLVETLKSLANTISRAKPVKFISNEKLLKLALGYTDASREPTPDGTFIAQLGGMFFFAKNDGDPSELIRFPFSYVITNAEHTIACYEALAILIALERFPKAMRSQFQLAIGVDNTTALFSIAKALTKNQFLAAATSLILEAFDDSTMLFYVPSKQNVADILTRDERDRELDKRLFTETVRTRPDDVERVIARVEKRAAEIRKFFSFDNKKGKGNN